MINQFYENFLGLDENWKVKSVDQNNENRTVTVDVLYAGKAYRCPECGGEAVLHDRRKRTVQHLDSCGYETLLQVNYPRVHCKKCGTKAIDPPFAAANSRFTHAFENDVINRCMKAPVQKVALDLGLNWHVIDGIKDRAFKRGSARRETRPKPKVKNIAVDETSFQKHHNYSTIVSDADAGTVLAVLDGRDAETLKHFFLTQQVADFSELESVSMDMAPPFIKAVRDIFPNADELICYDRFHVAQLFGRAVDAIRKRESEAFKNGKLYNPLARTKFEWLRNSGKADNRASKRREFIPLTRTKLQTAKAWKLKEMAAGLWDYARESTAAKAWKNLLWRLSHSRIGELKRLAASIKEHLQGILNAIKLRVSNAVAEARNSCIQRVKYTACGYRDKARFNREILFQFGGLDLSF